MIKRVIFFLCVLLFTPLLSFAINCSQTLTQDTILTEDLVCQSNGLTLNPNILLDCNNHKITGKQNGIGIDLTGSYNTVIKNCQIENFTTGINQKYQTITKSNGWGIYYETIYPTNNLIENNIFKNNNNAINLIETKSGTIKNNIFKNNTQNAINIDLLSIIEIYQNTFYNTTINYPNINDKTFCKNNIGNTYLLGATGPTCNCQIPKSNIIYDSSVNFCQGEYYLPNGIEIGAGPNRIIDCNNSIIYGANTGVGIKMAAATGTTLKNCIIKNYEKGIYLTYKTSSNNMARLNQIYDNTIYNTKFGIYMDNKARAENINNNTIIGWQYHIYNLNGFTKIDAKNNWFGTNNETYISPKIYDNNKMITYIPIKIINSTEDLNLKEINLNKTTINFQVEKLSLFTTITLDAQVLITSNNKIIDVFNQPITLTEKSNIFNINYNLKKGDKVSILIDPENKLLESDENNNFLEKSLEISDSIYLNLNSNSIENIEFEKYLKSNLGETTITQDVDNANVEIIIENLNSNIYELKYPYEGQIKSYQLNNKQIIEISGVDIDGQIAALKEFISNKNTYLDNESTFILNASNTDAIKVYDYLHLSDNAPFYKTQTDIFGRIINEILNDNTKEILELQVPVNYPNGTINYRMQKLNPKYSSIFKSYVDTDGYPIVMGGGLWSDITTWEELGSELANEGFEVYLIELTGGAESECDNCYNYPYEFLTDEVYPSYINSVLNLSGKTKVKYVGHSNGARTALDSLSKGALNQNKVDTLIAVGVPGAFEELSFFAQIIKDSGQIAIDRLNTENISHITFSRLSHEVKSNTGEIISFLNYLFGEDYKISTNLFSKYYYWINSSYDKQPGTNISVNNFALIYGNYKNTTNDRIVSVIDEEKIYNNIISNNKYLLKTYLPHNGMSNEIAIKYSIKKILKNEKLN